MKMKEKRGDVNYVVISIIVILISFFILLSFIATTRNFLVPEIDDLLCRGLITAESKSEFMGIYLYEIKQKCKVDEIKNVNLEDKDDSFKEIADEMKRCWFRYGEGEYDFLSKWDSEGNWCFLCGKVELEENSMSFPYKDFVEWTTYNYPKDEDKSYFDYINMVYTQVGDEEVSNLRTDFNELLREEGGSGRESTFNPLLIVLGERIEELDNMRSKRIDAEDKEVYVVYRFDRLNEGFETEIGTAKNKMYAGMAAGILTSVILEGAVEGAVVGAVAGSVVGPGGTAGVGLVGGTLGAIKGIFIGGYKTVVAFKNVFRIGRVIKRAGSFIKNSKNLFKGVKSIDEVLEFVKVEGKAIRVFKAVKSFTASTDEILEFAKYADDIGEVKMAGSLNDLSGLMKSYNINSLDELAVVAKGSPNDLIKFIDSTNADDLKRIVKIDGGDDAIKALGDIEALEELAKDELKAIVDKSEVVETVAVSDYVRTSVAVGSGLMGGYVGSQLNGNYNQYVDLMIREQYYRLCGTEPGLFERD